MAPPSLQVQTVLYGNPPGDVERFVGSMAVAAARARAAGAVGQVSLAIGDCSPAPVLDRAAIVARHGPAFDRVDYVHFGENLGSAGGHNRLFGSLAADVAIVSNADGYASPLLVTELLAPLGDPDVGIVEARQVPLEQPKAHDPTTGDTSWASGSCLAVRAEVVEATGGFDPSLFFLHLDDVDFSWRVRLAGWRVVHRPAAAFFHDKRLGPAGDLQASDAELRHSAEAWVLLPWRYSRRDVAEVMLARLQASGDPRFREAAERLLERQRAGDLPEPIDPEGRVAMFALPHYAFAPHRFTW